ncbi:DUF930 domain-containing protein [Mesorhizobium sp. BE184]|uniref:DUF930 domain-containing protein n=1 Tax=Mesorhizobium sp. BE184 TaxID=2817714 RepID=UPI00285C6044|nr:DUF930 domain-containing protein [Mesorhizobium sp. BE184]MDR7032112.1 hypothetical protein [Mesorhizobium sp. BE184]
MAARKAQRQLSFGHFATPQLRRWSVCASLTLHSVVLAFLALSPSARTQLPPREDSISVDMISPQQFEAMAMPKPIPPVLQAPEVEPEDRQDGANPQKAAPAPQPGMIQATQMLSAKTLADTRSRNVRADLASMAGNERQLQLCAVEAMDQIRHWRRDLAPDRVVPYATARERISGPHVQADGAAFRSKGNWYGLKFKCDFAAGGEAVTGFAFLVGDPVPRARWDELGLAPVH